MNMMSSSGKGEGEEPEMRSDGEKEWCFTVQEESQALREITGHRCSMTSTRSNSNSSLRLIKPDSRRPSTSSSNRRRTPDEGKGKSSCRLVMTSTNLPEGKEEDKQERVKQQEMKLGDEKEQGNSVEREGLPPLLSSSLPLPPTGASRMITNVPLFFDEGKEVQNSLETRILGSGNEEGPSLGSEEREKEVGMKKVEEKEEEEEERTEGKEKHSSEGKTGEKWMKETNDEEDEEDLFVTVSVCFIHHDALLPISGKRSREGRPVAEVAAASSLPHEGKEKQDENRDAGKRVPLVRDGVATTLLSSSATSTMPTPSSHSRNLKENLQPQEEIKREKEGKEDEKIEGRVEQKGNVEEKGRREAEEEETQEVQKGEERKKKTLLQRSPFLPSANPMRSSPPKRVQENPLALFSLSYAPSLLPQLPHQSSLLPSSSSISTATKTSSSSIRSKPTLSASSSPSPSPSPSPPSLSLLLHLLSALRDRHAPVTPPPLAFANTSPFVRVLCECYTPTGYRWGRVRVQRSPVVEGAVVVEVPGDAELRAISWWLERVMKEAELDHYYGRLWGMVGGGGGGGGVGIDHGGGANGMGGGLGTGRGDDEDGGYLLGGAKLFSSDSSSSGGVDGGGGGGRCRSRYHTLSTALGDGVGSALTSCIWPSPSPAGGGGVGDFGGVDRGYGGRLAGGLEGGGGGGRGFRSVPFSSSSFSSSYAHSGSTYRYHPYYAYGALPAEGAVGRDGDDMGEADGIFFPLYGWGRQPTLSHSLFEGDKGAEGDQVPYRSPSPPYLAARGGPMSRTRRAASLWEVKKGGGSVGDGGGEDMGAMTTSSAISSSSSGQREMTIPHFKRSVSPSTARRLRRQRTREAYHSRMVHLICIGHERAKAMLAASSLSMMRSLRISKIELSMDYPSMLHLLGNTIWDRYTQLSKLELIATNCLGANSQPSPRASINPLFSRLRQPGPMPPTLPSRRGVEAAKREGGRERIDEEGSEGTQSGIPRGSEKRTPTTTPRPLLSPRTPDPCTPTRRSSLTNPRRLLPTTSTGKEGKENREDHEEERQGTFLYTADADPLPSSSRWVLPPESSSSCFSSDGVTSTPTPTVPSSTLAITAPATTTTSINTQPTSPPLVTNNAPLTNPTTPTPTTLGFTSMSANAAMTTTASTSEGKGSSSAGKGGHLRFPPMLWTPLDVFSSKGNGGALRGLEFLPLLRELNLSNSLIDGIGFMGKSKTLQKLNLSNTSISNPGLQGLQECMSLKVLILFQCPSITSVKSLTPLYYAHSSDGLPSLGTTTGASAGRGGNSRTSSNSSTSNNINNNSSSISNTSATSSRHRYVDETGVQDDHAGPSGDGGPAGAVLGEGKSSTPPPMNLEMLDLRGTSVNTQGLIGLGLLPRLRSLRLGRTKVTHLRPALAHAPALTHLDLEHCTTLHPEEGLEGMFMGGAGEENPTPIQYLNLTRANTSSLGALARARTLQCLVASRVVSLAGRRLPEMFLTDAFGGSCLWSLSHLDLSHSPLDATQCMEVLVQCVNLQYVNLTRTPNLTSIDGLEQLQYLREVHLSHTAITSVNCFGQGAAPSLTHLNASHTSLEDEGITWLHLVPRLSLLDLTDTQISHVGHLHACPSLKVLILSSTLVSSNGLRGLEKSLTLEELYLNEALVKHFTTWDVEASAICPLSYSMISLPARTEMTDDKRGKEERRNRKKRKGTEVVEEEEEEDTTGGAATALDLKRKKDAMGESIHQEMGPKKVFNPHPTVDRGRGSSQWKKEEEDEEVGGEMGYHMEGDMGYEGDDDEEETEEEEREEEGSPALEDSRREAQLRQLWSVVEKVGKKYMALRSADSTLFNSPSFLSSPSVSSFSSFANFFSSASTSTGGGGSSGETIKCTSHGSTRRYTGGGGEGKGEENKGGDRLPASISPLPSLFLDMEEMNAGLPGSSPHNTLLHPFLLQLWEWMMSTVAESQREVEKERRKGEKGQGLGATHHSSCPTPVELKKEWGENEKASPTEHLEKVPGQSPPPLFSSVPMGQSATTTTSQMKKSLARRGEGRGKKMENKTKNSRVRFPPCSTIFYPSLWKLSVAHTRHRSSGLIGILQLPRLVELDVSDTWIDSPLGLLFPFSAAVAHAFALAVSEWRGGGQGVCGRGGPTEVNHMGISSSPSGIPRPLREEGASNIKMGEGEEEPQIPHMDRGDGEGSIGTIITSTTEKTSTGVVMAPLTVTSSAISVSMRKDAMGSAFMQQYFPLLFEVAFLCSTYSPCFPFFLHQRLQCLVLCDAKLQHAQFLRGVEYGQRLEYISVQSCQPSLSIMLDPSSLASLAACRTLSTLNMADTDITSKDVWHLQKRRARLVPSPCTPPPQISNAILTSLTTTTSTARGSGDSDRSAATSIPSTRGNTDAHLPSSPSSFSSSIGSSPPSSCSPPSPPLHFLSEGEAGNSRKGRSTTTKTSLREVRAHRNRGDDGNNGFRPTSSSGDVEKQYVQVKEAMISSFTHKAEKEVVEIGGGGSEHVTEISSLPHWSAARGEGGRLAPHPPAYFSPQSTSSYQGIGPWKREEDGLDGGALRISTDNSIPSQYTSTIHAPTPSSTSTKTSTSIVSLNLSGTILTDLNFLCFHRHLRVLRLSATIVRDLSPLQYCCDLHMLDVSKTRILDLRPLSSCQSLRYLFASDTFTTQIGIQALPSLCHLEVLDLSGTPITSILLLRPLSQLSLLRIKNTAVPRAESKCFPPGTLIQQ